MKTTALRMCCIAALLLIPGAFAMKEATAPDSQGRQGHLSALTARITLPDGTIRVATIDGLGCTASLCSRVAIKGRTDGGSMVSFWLDSLAVIQDIIEKHALLVMKNGAKQRVSLVTDFRVLYLANRSGNAEKLDLARIKSLEFLPTTTID
jgi:hypothetical protein